MKSQNSMKLQTLMVSLAVALTAGVASGHNEFSVFESIPNGSPLGLVSSGTVSGLPGGTVTSLTVDLNISGGFNGGLYGYLVAPGGTTVQLMNQPQGGSAGGSGMNVTLVDSAAVNLQNAAEPAGDILTGSFQAAGSLASFNGVNGNGQWTLFVADLAVGGGTPQLNIWGLDFAPAPVPEPDQTMGLAVLGSAAFGIWTVRWLARVRRQKAVAHQ
jgi:subtilisin-like proprotein convertase family protein